MCDGMKQRGEMCQVHGEPCAPASSFKQKGPGELTDSSFCTKTALAFLATLTSSAETMQ